MNLTQGYEFNPRICLTLAAGICALAAEIASLSRTFRVLARLHLAARLGRLSGAHRSLNALSVILTSRQSSSHLYIIFRK
jgi:hypothetical protein